MDIPSFLRRSLYISIASAIFAEQALADTPQPPVKIGVVSVTVPTSSISDSTPISIPTGPNTGYTIKGSALPILGGPGQSNPYLALQMLPSVVAQNPSPYGMTNLVGGTKGIRIRGESNPHGAIGTVEGLPLFGIDPGPGSLFLFDLENVSHISVYAGAIPPSKISIFTTQGVLDEHLLWPQKNFGGVLSQTFGSTDFYRSFLRIDSGTLPTDTRVFASFSYTHGGNWQGPGATPAYRYNAETGISQRLSSQLKLQLFAAYNNMKETNAYPLNYAQAADIGNFYHASYNNTLSQIPAQDVNYYRYNQQRFQDYAILGKISYQPSKNLHFDIKPFYSQENGYYRYGAAKTPGIGTPGVVQWDIDHHNYGFLSTLSANLYHTHLKLGYWFENLQPPGPPTAWQAYTFTPDGQLSFVRWAILAKPTTNHIFNSPFVQLQRNFGPVSITTGARYLIETTPSFTVYNTSGIPSASYGEALEMAHSINSEASVTGQNLHQWLPYFGISWRLYQGTNLDFSWSRNYGAPAFNDWPPLIMNSAVLAKHGLSVQSIYNGLRPETSNSYNLGMSVKRHLWYVKGTLFYTTYDHKLVSIYDPQLGFGYTQNVGTANAYGAELSGAVMPLPNLTLYGSFTYNRAQLTRDFRNETGGIVYAQGSQLPDTPRYIANLSVSYRYHHYYATVSERYMGMRYAATGNQMPIPGYFLTNLDLGYRYQIAGVGTLVTSLNVANLFNRHYVGLIDSSYLQDPTGINFYAGAPITVSGNVTLRF
ncbi:MAG: TonB-dependent receptor [Acidithiobacillus sp.]